MYGKVTKTGQRVPTQWSVVSPCSDLPEKLIRVHYYSLNSTLCSDFTSLSLIPPFCSRVPSRRSHIVVTCPQPPLVCDSFTAFCPCLTWLSPYWPVYKVLQSETVVISLVIILGLPGCAACFGFFPSGFSLLRVLGDAMKTMNKFSK